MLGLCALLLTHCAPPPKNLPMSDTADRSEIRDLVERFHDAVNHRDFTVLRGLFTNDGVWEVAPPFEHRFVGPVAIEAGIGESVGRLEFLVQSCSPSVVDIRGEQASGRTSMQEFGRFRDGSSMRVAGTYFDTFRKVEGRWRFTHRVFRARYADDTPLPGRVFDAE
ncbi:hypothetical protein AKJ09_00752 [Labilithrix luteola]|uniref:SnoaL-like domain-containing protein n=1 Tax=Labilithrix luteola TaxID=1391654 RepID=A0A0K1PKM4_9BACT|nr:hypothetical protein AKJ09_00752 [Labilithrix luteola]